MVYGYIFIFFNPIGLFFGYCSTNGCFFDMLELEELSNIFLGQKQTLFGLKMVIFVVLTIFRPKNGCFWTKKCRKGLLTLAYLKSTH